MSLRVLHVGAGNLYGGVESLLATMARYRHTCPELDQSFALFFPGRIRDELNSSGAATFDLGEVRLSRPWSVLTARNRFRQTVASFDVVICHSVWPHLIAAPVARAAAKRIALWTHGIPSGHWLERLAVRCEPDLIIANSRYTASAIHTAFGSKHNVQCIYCPVQPAGVLNGVSRDAMRSAMGTSPESVVVLQACRMEAWKGHRMHLRALGLLANLPGWECWIAGGVQRPEEAMYVATLKKLAADLGIASRVRFLGERSDVRSLMTAADIFCQPNEGPEPFGIALIEALWAGLPVVTSALGGAIEIVDSRCGILTDPTDVGVLANTLRRLITNLDLRRSLGSAGPNRAKQLCDPRPRLQDLYGHLSALCPTRDVAVNWQ